MPKNRHRGHRQHRASQASSRQHRKQPPGKAKNKYSTLSSSNAAKIDEYMASHGVIRRSIIGDGNCLFRAMADQLGFGEERHCEIREKVVRAILADKEYFQDFIDGEEVDSVEAYCEEMSKDGVWGDDIELEAFRRAYKKAIVIYDASTGTPYVKPFNGDEGKTLNTIHLWKSDCHYESIRNIEGPFDGPSRVVYKDVELSKEDVERINREHEDSVINELRIALPNISVEEIQMKYKQLGDPDKVLEFYTGDLSYYVETKPNDTEPKVAEQQEEEPRNNVYQTPGDTIPGVSVTNDSNHEMLSTSMEFLSLNTDIPNPTSVKHETKSELDEEEEEPRREMVVQPSPSPSVDVTSPKHKGRQRRHESSARKERRAKQERKEAAKRRKQQQKMGIIKTGHNDTISDVQDHSTLKVIII